MATSNIATLLRQALTTFAGRSEAFRQNIEHLKGLLDKITATDVGLHSHFCDGTYWHKEHRAPVTYIDIYEDNVITMGIFVLKPGMKLPLHDHPEMFGLIKVLTGKLKISSFTIKNHEDMEQTATLYPAILTAEQHSDIVADVSSESCVLEPVSRNLHEIESVGGAPAAFLDILSPPYETLAEFGPRKCTYFKVIRQLGPKLFNLMEMPQPSWFWSDTFPYTGPELFEEKIRE